MGLFNDNSWEPKAPAKAVRALLESSEIESSWCDTESRYLAEPNIAEWHNFPERGFVIGVWNKGDNQLNIAFFEHRNSDEIHAIKWVSDVTLNPPTIDDVPKDHPFYNDNYSTDHHVAYDKYYAMARWIEEQIEDFWRAHEGV